MVIFTLMLLDVELRGFHQFFVFPVFWYCRIGYNLTTKIASFIDVWFLIKKSTENLVYEIFFSDRKGVEQCNRATFLYDCFLVLFYVRLNFKKTLL